MAGSEGHRVLTMAAHTCPFCKGVISADLAQFGGNCPHCMLEVPGEDAPTDPGAILRQKQAEEDRKRAAAQARSRQVQLGVVAAAAVLFLAGGGYYFYSHRQAAVYELDDYYVQPLEEIAAAPTTPTPAAVPTLPGKKGAKPPPGTPVPATPTAGTPPVAATPGTTTPIAHTGSGGADAVASATPSLMTTGTATAGTVSLGGITTDITQPGVVLSDQQQIFDMAKTVINRSSPQLQACYQSRLKQVPDLAGAWKVELTITKAGTTSGVNVSGQDQHDAELETCMERSIAGWHFMKIAFDQPVAKTYRFKPSS